MSATDSRTQNRTPVEDADVCIVGAGVAGGLVAHGLAARGYEVVILEAGERFDPTSRQQRMEEALRPGGPGNNVWGMGGERDKYRSSGPLEYPLNETRVKGVGGSTLHWLGTSPRLHEKDFEMNSRYGVATDWPISYADLRPYYAAAESELGVAGARDNPFEPPRENDFPMEAFPASHSDSLFTAACGELGITTHSVPQARNSEVYDGRSQCLGYSTCIPVCPSGAKYSGDVHVRKAESAGVRVIDQAPVQRLEHDDAGDVVTAAVYTTPGGDEHRQTADQFVLACGAVENVRLLLLSESETYPDGLANSSGVVGHYFMDHPGIRLGGVIDAPTNPNPIGFHTMESHQFVDQEESFPASFKLEFWNAHPRSLPDIALRGGDRNVHGDLRDVVEGDAWGDRLVDAIDEQLGENRMFVRATTEPLPQWENTVTLDRSTTDAHGNPVPDVSIGISDRGRRTLEHARGIQREIMAELGATDLSGQDPSRPHYGAHHMGTTRMGNDPTESVVDARLRTHDLENLSIASGSTFVTAGALNPTLTIAALALKAVDHIDEDL